jgi:hypothetical protein
MIKESKLYALLTKQANRETTAPLKVRISSLKEELAATDYKVIKCAEYSLAKLDAPYDIAALHAERQKIRDEINSLEIEVSKME